MAEIQHSAPKDVGALRLPKCQFPKFSGQLRDYPTFKDDWKQQIESALSDKDQLIKVRKCVPARVKSDVSSKENMAEVWEFLDDEYSKPTEICAKFPYSKDAKTVGQKFKEMYTCFNEVYNDLQKISCVEQLNHAISLKMFMQKLPSKDLCMKYVEFKMLQET